ncbi:hydroxyethylthiazole kinase [Methanoplanus endosymbiosus]|uniref:Hydroxyethylthiazole kinase n=1 Tax=Methanoplanus endosymbiosus TaxID=33865 RepID=A0A9E7PJZ5_9EURY|nr:hydroxyethylthiazole kinase [Methanoplanus endosymbiosus]UUX91293.1 hydroxyethylthiazole kinase [Methanoplanus endosymbiosus]
MDSQDIFGLLDKVRAEKPLIHHITNYVTVNDCANITICAGASPVMAHYPDDAEEMAAIAGALVLNIGTLSPELVDAMIIAGKRANETGVPVILDPVGAGATKIRTESTFKILKEVRISVIKGNAGEISVIAGTGGVVRGVDSGGISGEPLKAAEACSDLTGATVLMTGPTDIVTDGRRSYSVSNGHPMMGSLSGTGCMAASLCGSFAPVADDLLISSLAAAVTFGIAGEIAGSSCRGPYSFRTELFDTLFRMKRETIERYADFRTI